MPRPVYILCADSVSEDKTTNRLSVFNMIEVVTVSLGIAPDEGKGDDGNEDAGPSTRLQQTTASVAVAVWMCEEGDSDQEFEHEFAIHFADDERIVPARVQFQFDPEKPLQRFRLRIGGYPILDEDCLFEVESRVRPCGTDEWQGQRYPIILKAAERQPAAAATSTPAN